MRLLECDDPPLNLLNQDENGMGFEVVTNIQLASSIVALSQF